jgi:ketosteroid isomerase-like protein
LLSCVRVAAAFACETPSVSSDRVTTARMIVEQLNARDPEGLAALLHPEFEFFSLLASVDGTSYRGVDGLRSYFAEIEETWEDTRFELDQVDDLGEVSLIVMHVSGRARASGVPLDERTAQVWRWREGKLWRNVVYLDAAEARAAAQR